MLTFDGWSAFFFLPKVPPPPPPTLKPLLRVEAALGKSLATIDFRLFFLITSRRRRAAGRAIPICKVRENICILKKILMLFILKYITSVHKRPGQFSRSKVWQTPHCRLTNSNLHCRVAPRYWFSYIASSLKFKWPWSMHDMRMSSLLMVQWKLS